MTVRISVVFALLVCSLLAQAPFMRWYEGPLGGATTIEGVGDFDFDGDVDVFSDGNLHLNDGHGNLAVVVASGLLPSARLAFADFNGDGYADVLSVAGVASLQLSLGGPGLVFTTPGGSVPTFVGIPGTPQLPTSAVAGDVDLDGDLDLIISGYTFAGGLVTVPVLLLNNGAAVFSLAPATVLASAGPSFGEALVDLDGDGDLDFVSYLGTTQWMQTLRWMPNNGGTFGAPVVLAGTPFPGNPGGTTMVGATVFGDFDGNGVTDVARPSWWGVTIHLSTAAGPGSAVTSTAPFASATNLGAIDLDGDSRDELVVGRWGGAGIGVHAVSASGVLSPPTQIIEIIEVSTGGTFWPFDMDGDGDLDLVRSAINAYGLMNDGVGGLVYQGPDLGSHRRFLIGDLDGDGDNDVLEYYPGLMQMQTNDGHGTFAAGPLSTFTGLGGAMGRGRLLDHDGDGDLDLYLSRGTVFGAAGTDLMLANDGTGAYSPVPAGTVDNGHVHSVESADVDGDGDLDVILGRSDVSVTQNDVRLVRNLGGTFAAPVPIAGSGAAGSLGVSDFDGDGDPDVLQMQGPPTIGGPTRLLVNDGTGAFVLISLPSMTGGSCTVGDLTGDGLPEVLTELNLWINTGGGTFVLGPALPVPLIRPPTLADVDEDGDLDLVELDGAVFLNVGGGSFSPPVSQYPRPGFGFSHIPVRAVDFDRDGDLDHISTSGRLFRGTTRHIQQRVPARPGRPFALDLYGRPAGGYSLYLSTSPVDIPVPPFGVLGLDPWNAVLVQIGSFSGSTSPTPGQASLTVTLPFDPSLVGATVYWQMIDGIPRLSNRVTTTVQGY